MSGMKGIMVVLGAVACFAGPLSSAAGAGTALTGKGVGEWSGPQDDPVVETAAQKNLEHDMETLKYLLETR